MYPYEIIIGVVLRRFATQWLHARRDWLRYEAGETDGTRSRVLRQHDVATARPNTHIGEGLDEAQRSHACTWDGGPVPDNDHVVVHDLLTGDDRLVREAQVQRRLSDTA